MIAITLFSYKSRDVIINNNLTLIIKKQRPSNEKNFYGPLRHDCIVYCLQ
ncbi:hypothetical protein LX64_03798 [Chitinophaga skermanii]|uniref:Uncharacterized protein n=1 Tax=Chitinophaga skermanii TaxID=331697 RepID=A0A327QD67_9BACT|nr:hypothetical protein LX64_03798 [Chitinophaga skermanii]